MHAPESQLSSTVLMIRPVRFQQNPLTAASNRFMADLDATPAEQQSAAARQFDGLVQALSDADVEVIVFDDTPEPHTPDSIFPNNWVSFHADGRVVLYPMEAPNRRTERRRDILDALVRDYRFVIDDIVDLSHNEKRGLFLEGTGSLVLDRVQRVAFACLSSRTHTEALEEFGACMGYDIVCFDAVDRDGYPIYHTNVVMSVGETLAPVCLEAVPDPQQQQAIVERLEINGRSVMPLSFHQLECFAGNMLEVANRAGERVVAMSESALQSLDAAQRTALENSGHIVAADISDIEASAGGSVRCMLASVHLPRLSA